MKSWTDSWTGWIVMNRRGQPVPFEGWAFTKARLIENFEEQCKHPFYGQGYRAVKVRMTIEESTAKPARIHL